MASESVTFYFDSIGAAAAGLLTVLLDAKETEKFYRFGGLDSRSIYTSGLQLEGEITDIATKLDKIPGSVRQDG